MEAYIHMQPGSCSHRFPHMPRHREGVCRGVPLRPHRSTVSATDAVGTGILKKDLLNETQENNQQTRGKQQPGKHNPTKYIYIYI